MKLKLLIFLFFVACQAVLAKPELQFISPKPGSKYIKSSASIILRFSSQPDESFLRNSLIQITGSKSGVHHSNAKLSSDGLTIIFTPKEKFINNEIVNVRIEPIKTKADYSEIINFSFETEKENIVYPAEKFLKNELATDKNIAPLDFTPLRTSNNLPADFPQVTVTNSISPSPGYIFLSNFSINFGATSYYLMILDNNGTPVYYQKLDTSAYDFKKQPNGNLTYFSSGSQKFYMMNPQYQIIDSFACGNGYSTDLHELQIYPNGHALLMSYDPQTIDMSDYVSNGDTSATVIGLVVQELDGDKNVIFQWRSWDYFDILDATHTNFTIHEIDYVHGNALDFAADGNILISSRHQDEITKINRNTGAIIWRLGGKNNQFTFINETLHFSHQHAIRQLPNGNITLFDNGNYPTAIDPTHGDNLMLPVSRALEYNINESTKEATLVWSYINDLGTYAFAMGYMERLSNGNSIIGWGAANPTVTEVNAAGQKVFEMTLPAGQVSYRAFRDSWTPIPFGEQIPTSFNVYQNYPNPFNPGTTIKFDVPDQGDVKISVFNILGQTIQEELRNNLTPGQYSFFFDGSNLSAGVYFYRIKINSFTDTKKMILVK